MRPTPTFLSAAAALLALASLPASAGDEPARPALGLMGTIPIYWGESDGLGDLLSGTNEAHWARAALEVSHELHPLSYIDADALAPYRLLLLAQPRALSGEENVALDAWVRAGGRLLLFADPMMTGHSRYALGDRRRPQDVILLSPILRHWGLELEYDEDPVSNPTLVDVEGMVVPVDSAGRFAPLESEDDCAISPTGILAQCRVGAGTAVILADAAVLDMERTDQATAALAALVHRAFD